MKSIRIRILLWSFAIVLCSMLAFVGLTLLWAYSGNGPIRPLRQAALMRAEDAEALYRSGDMQALRRYLDRIDTRFTVTHHLVDTTTAQDVLTGHSYAELLRAGQPSLLRPMFFRGELAALVPTSGGRLMLVIQSPFPTDLLTIRYLLLIVVAMAVFSWLLAVDLVGPLRQMAESVGRFGAGDLDARMHITRNDEIGQLARSFDQMADRISSLAHARRRLLQDIAHELRSPLARLSVGVQLAKREDHRANALAQMEREINRLGELVTNLVGVSRTPRPGLESESRPLRLDSLVVDIVDGCRLEAEARGTSITVSNRAGDLELWGDYELLWRAVENVVRNAILHSPPESVIEVTVERAKEGSVLVSVRDFGPGVAVEELTRIFEPFYRTDLSRQASTGGVGLGLSIAQRAVLLHRGAIEAANAVPGLRITIRLPLARETETSVHPVVGANASRR